VRAVDKSVYGKGRVFRLPLTLKFELLD
jgi:hypothetical protein